MTDSADTTQPHTASTRLRLLETQGSQVRESAAMALALQQATAGVGALGGFVHLRRGARGGLSLVAADGLGDKITNEWAYLPYDHPAPPARAAREGVPVRAPGDGMGVGAAGMIAFPLSDDEGALGALSLVLAHGGAPDRAQRSFLLAVAAWAAERSRSAEHAHDRPAGRLADGTTDDPVLAGAERVAMTRTARMDELTSALAEAVTAKDVVRAAAERILPPFGADGLIIQAIEGTRLHVVGSMGYPHAFLDRYLDGIPLDSNAAVTDVLRRRSAAFIESAADFARRYPALSHTLPESGKNAWAILPLIASSRAIGSLAVSFSRPRRFEAQERALLSALSALVAQALERARLFDAEHNRAQWLQRGLLPRSLPSLPAATAAARYLPAGQGAAVGGDWYDLIPLSADRVAMVIGDVMGHGIAEAATMGRLRTAVRTLADLELPPEEILGHLNELVEELGDDCYVTCLYAVFDPVSGTCTFCRAGHLPPAIVQPDGTLHCPDIPANPPLGAAKPPFDTCDVRLPEESLIVYCTDGLLRSVSRDIDEGIAQLVRTLASAVAESRGSSVSAAHDGNSLDDLCEAVTSALLHGRVRTSDDAALFITRTRRTDPADVASWPLPDDPRAAAQARELIRRQLDAWQLGDLTDTTELIVSELVGNAIRHARGPLHLRLLRSRSLVCEVFDGSLTTPRIRRAEYTDEGGRGLYLIAAFCRRWGARYIGEDGKCIWAEQELVAQEAGPR